MVIGIGRELRTLCVPLLPQMLFVRTFGISARVCFVYSWSLERNPYIGAQLNTLVQPLASDF